MPDSPGFDTVIIGGGIIGLATALKISRLDCSGDHRLALFEAGTRLGRDVATIFMSAADISRPPTWDP